MKMDYDATVERTFEAVKNKLARMDARIGSVEEKLTPADRSQYDPGEIAKLRSDIGKLNTKLKSQQALLKEMTAYQYMVFTLLSKSSENHRKETIALGNLFVDGILNLSSVDNQFTKAVSLLNRAFADDFSKTLDSEAAKAKVADIIKETNAVKEIEESQPPQRKKKNKNESASEGMDFAFTAGAQDTLDPETDIMSFPSE